MRSSAALVHPQAGAVENERREALDLCRGLLSQEGFTVSWAPAAARHRVRPPDLLATNGSRHVRIIVLLEREVDAPEAQARIRASLSEGETRVCVPWPLRWRALSNLQRWGLNGASVAGW